LSDYGYQIHQSPRSNESKIPANSIDSPNPNSLTAFLEGKASNKINAAIDLLDINVPQQPQKPSSTCLKSNEAPNGLVSYI
jgi:hypothetical protein